MSFLGFLEGLWSAEPLMYWGISWFLHLVVGMVPKGMGKREGAKNLGALVFGCCQWTSFSNSSFFFFPFIISS